jgi:outer membrane lipoprotein-sorting protein
MMRLLPRVSATAQALSSGAALLLSCATFLVPAVRGQTVDEVIAANIQARGGMDKLKSVQTLRASGKLLAGSTQLNVVQVNKRADKVREEATLQGLTQVQVYDGKGAWQIDPFGGRREPMLMSQDDAKSLVIDADIDHPLVDYNQKGHKAELLGHDSVEGTDCYKIKLTLKNGDEFTYYLDTDSHLELKLETKMTIRGAFQENETYYGDYEAVDGIYFPFAVETAQKGDPNRVKITVEKVEINIPVDDSTFVMPAAKPGTKAASASK